ncbi:MAG TPA: hypothetical protein VFQ74_02070 [Pseudolysinimonas sp.]|nr:hypothetical protein [Pseudolysinimonas sp.]
MDQLGNFAGTARQVAQAAHEQATAHGLEPVPTVIILGLAAVFALVCMVVGGRGRGRVPRHSLRA